MLRSYSAQLNGEKIIWLDRPPTCAPGALVLVVVQDEGDASPQPRTTAVANYQLTDLAGRLQWSGDALAAQRTQRDAW